MILRGGRRAASAYLATWRRFNKKSSSRPLPSPRRGQGPDMKDARDAVSTPPSGTAKRRRAVIRCLAWAALLLGSTARRRGQTAPPKAVREGEHRPAGRGLQRALEREARPVARAVDRGDFGSGTRAALVRFQRARADGDGGRRRKDPGGTRPVAKPTRSPTSAVVNAEKRVSGLPIRSTRPRRHGQAWAIADGKTTADPPGQGRGEAARDGQHDQDHDGPRSCSAWPRGLGRARRDRDLFLEAGRRHARSTTGVRVGERYRPAS